MSKTRTTDTKATFKSSTAETTYGTTTDDATTQGLYSHTLQYKVKKCSICISEYIQINFFYLSRFFQKTINTLL